MFNTRAALIALTLAVTAAAPALHAQGATQNLKVNVPFAFQVGDYHFAPGLYSMHRTGHFLSIDGADGTRTTMTDPENDAKMNWTTKVVFNRYGDRYFMHEIWSAGDTGHTRIVDQKAEQQVRKAYLATMSNRPAPTQIASIEATK